MISHFDFLASIYDRFIGLKDATRLQKVLGLPTPGILLDAGGGTARVSAQLMHLVNHLVICDLSQKMLRQAKNKGGLSPIQSHVEQLPFSDESFQRIMVVDSFHHFSDHRRSVVELLRVLEPGGKLVIEVPDIARLPVKLVALAEKLFLMQSHFFRPTRFATCSWQPAAKLLSNMMGTIPRGASLKNESYTRQGLFCNLLN